SQFSSGLDDISHGLDLFDVRIFFSVIFIASLEASFDGHTFKSFDRIHTSFTPNCFLSNKSHISKTHFSKLIIK
ncbi:hypothetical protein NL356_29610, partial [Klebsiella pneumoniae]|nr:hypothetical protein [Klebsiella pneumoniae]